jgi:hypothetical protein
MGFEMEENIISWNLPNWITIFLMAALSFAIAGAIAGVVRAKRAASGDADA